MQQEAAQELFERKSQHFLFVVVSGVALAKSDCLFRKNETKR